MRQGAEVPLIGREGELFAIRECLARAAAGTREAVLFEGEAGIGKTRLISECVKQASDAGFTVVRGAADEIEQARPYGVLLSAFQSCAPDLSRRLGSLPTEPGDQRLAIVDSLVSIFDDATKAAPVALILDDLHWADNETLRALRATVRRTASIPFALVVSCRPPTAATELEALIETFDNEGLHVDLKPLDDDAVSALVSTLGAESPSSDLRARLASAQGNPFFVIEIIASAGDGSEEAEIPKSLRRTVLRRVLQLSEDALSLLRVAALHGGAIDPEELATVTGGTVLELLGPLDEAVKARVLDERDGSLIFRHEIVREAVYTDMPVSVRKKVHRDAARALAASGASARRVAAHLSAAADPGDGEAVSWLRRAAAEEMQRSPTLAADMLERAEALLDGSDRALEEIQAERVQALVWAGRVSEASMLAEDVLTELHDTSLASDVRVRLGEAVFFQGRVQAAGDHFQAAGDNAPDADRGLVLAMAALSKLLCGQLDLADSLASGALAEAESTKDPRALSLATAVRANLLLAIGDGSALNLAREAVRLANEDILGEAHRYGAHGVLGLVLAENDLFGEAVDALRRGIALDERVGIAWALPVYHAMLGLAQFLRGEWDDSVAELETLKGLHDDMDSTLFGPLAHGLLANIAVHRNDVARAEAEIAWGEEQLAERGPQVGVEYLIHGRILIAEANGETATALGLAKAACQFALGMGLQGAFKYYGPTLARVAAANGTPEESRFAVEAAEEYAQRSGVNSAMGAAHLCRAMLEADANLIIDAVQILSETPRRLELAMAHEQAGLIFAGSRQSAEAKDHFQSALAVYDELNARLDVARVTEALGAVGGRRRQARPARPVTGWESLSPTERRVVSLVAEGLSNAAVAERLSVSRRTVETHVYHVFQKLALSSRAELAARASRETAAPEVQ